MKNKISKIIVITAIFSLLISPFFPSLDTSAVEINSNVKNDNNLLIKFDNNPPGKPETPHIERADPQADYCRNIDYYFETRTSDSDGDKIKYGWDWNGDNIIDEWDDNYGNFYVYAEIDTAHEFVNSGTFTVYVLAEDEHGAKSEWSDPFEFYICPNCAPVFIHPLDGLDETNVGLKTDNDWPYFLNIWDPESEQLYYYFDWGDGTNTGWITEPTATHRWKEKGIFTIEAKAKDEHGAGAQSPYESWRFLTVNVGPKAKIINFFKIDLFKNLQLSRLLDL